MILTALVNWVALVIGFVGLYMGYMGSLYL